MKLFRKSLVLGSSLSAAMVFFAVPGMAAATHECTAGKPTAASNTWNFKGEANSLFEKVQADADKIENHADKIQSFASDSTIDWQVHAPQLNALKSEVDDIGAKLCRLETIRPVLSKWQQAEVDRIGANTLLMADNAQDAITFLNNNQQELWAPVYRKYANNLYDEAHTMAQSLHTALASAHASKQYRTLRTDINKPVS
jgi:hypothetical protein